MSMVHTWERLLASDRRNAEDRAQVFMSGKYLVIVIADGAGRHAGRGLR
jgi:hypothetical protein